MLVVATWGQTVVSIAIIFVSLLLIGLVLIQKNRGSGLSGAFGGVGGNTAFGTKTGDFLTWLTVGLTGAFILLSIVGVYLFKPPEKAAAVPAAAVPQESAPAPTNPAEPATTSPPAAEPTNQNQPPAEATPPTENQPAPAPATTPGG